jgi:transitional endoplasmic reticulum ATPase
MELTVDALDGRDPDGVAVLNRESMAQLGLDSGGFVLIRGPDGDRAVAQVLPDDDVSDGHVRIDELLRRTADVETGERVTVERIAVESADGVTVGFPEGFAVDDNLDLSVRKELISRAVVEGQVVPVTFSSRGRDGSERTVPVRILETEPADAVVIRDWSRITIAPEPVEDLPSVFDSVRGSNVTYADVGGLEDALSRLRETVELPLRQPDLFARLGVETPRGVLLYGPPGTGKTLVGRALATETDAHFETVSGPALASMHRSEMEQRLRESFETAVANSPAILFVDELDAIAATREGQDAAGDGVAQLLSMVDDMGRDAQTIVVATTNRPENIDAALRRPGRFDREVEIGVPDQSGREEILRIHTRGMPLADDVDLERLAERTHGFVGADIANLTREAALCAIRRAGIDLDSEPDTETLATIAVAADDIESALRNTEPSALREVFVEIPEVSWSAIGGLTETKQRLRETVQWPLDHPDAFERVSLSPATGLILYGPPGTGKTLLAKAVASESDSNFISVKGPELLDKYVGESERGVREIFEKARTNAPTVVFFDEIDAIAAERGGRSGDSGVGERVVSQLLTELDGLEELEDVVVIATTNRRDLLDEALLRPGRFDRQIHVDAPDEAGRREIFEVHTRDRPLTDDVDLANLAARTEGYVGADIEAVCREAATVALREFVEAGGTDTETIYLTSDHFETAIEEVEQSSDDTRARSPH